MEKSNLVTVEFTLRGTCPLLQHNERLANPFDTLTKAIAVITSKRTRQTDEDRIQVTRLEWEGGLYFNEQGPYIPGPNVKKCIMEAASLYRGGKDVQRALTPLDIEIPLIYAGPRNIEEMWAHPTVFVDQRGARVNGRSKIIRTRPKFPNWSIVTRMLLNVTALSLDDLILYTENAGRTTGLGDYRPTFGRFEGQVLVVG